MWPWRDWVIGAFNSNMPFDQFTIAQLAGDLLPNATREQKIATGFNRNHMINYEGGAIPEEYQMEYVADRVDTTANVFMGLTMGIVAAPCIGPVVVPLDAGWSDVGSWSEVWNILEKDPSGNVVQGEGNIILEGASNNLAYSNQPCVALVGVDNLVVIAMGDAVLVALAQQLRAE
jgi:hypothetical protein